ncbi:MAG: GNAT family N-acetyltransferase [Verrucomicrobiota bacterium]|nr:GNAT family N-acetyltransferase [Verrucomicrobiota bacterium]
MKLVRFERFTWNLDKFGAVPRAAIDPHYRVRVAEEDEHAAARTVVQTAFALDPQWGDTYKILRAVFEEQIEAENAAATLRYLVVTHGSRIIGASIMGTNPGAANHLVSGPCILNEYRNRGLATALLYESLAALKQAGIPRAAGVTKAGTLAAKFLYRKFGSAVEPYEPEPELAAA